jgi:hypothetical protein
MLRQPPRHRQHGQCECVAQASRRAWTYSAKTLKNIKNECFQGQGCIKLLRSIRQGWVPISFSETNPAGLAAGSRWSARGKGADHRVNADKASCTQKGCQNGCQPGFDLTRTGAGFTSERAVLASLQDARISSPRVRGSFPLLPRNDPRLPAANPAGLDWSAKSNGKTSRKPAPACTNPSLMQPWAV